MKAYIKEVQKERFFSRQLKCHGIDPSRLFNLTEEKNTPVLTGHSKSFNCFNGIEAAFQFRNLFAQLVTDWIRFRGRLLLEEEMCNPVKDVEIRSQFISKERSNVL